MSVNKIILMLIVLNPVIFGIGMGLLLRRRRLPSAGIRVAVTLAYFIVTYTALWIALQVIDLHPTLPDQLP